MESSGNMDLTAGKLHGQVAVITGGGRGIGRAIAIAFAREGMRVVCSGRNLVEIERTVSEIAQESGESIPVRADVTSQANMEMLMEVAVQRYGQLDIALLNAGTLPKRTPVQELPAQVWKECIDTNLTGAFFGMRAAIPHLRRSGGGKILCIGSGAATSAPQGSAAYAASKAGLTALIRSAARELRAFEIAVNELQPGPTATAMHGVIVRDVHDVDIANVPIERRGSPGEWFKLPATVASLALFIARLPNNGPTGQIFSLNSFH
jgi:3-oxoacyl-[acyl-carrier protein] reductase